MDDKPPYLRTVRRPSGDKCIIFFTRLIYMNQQKEPCCVCFDENYNQNDHFICNHPLCSSCYYQLNHLCCPICRSRQCYPYYTLRLYGSTQYVISINLAKYCLYSINYTNFMKKHLKLRVSNKELIQKVNRYREGHKFIIVKGKYHDLTTLYNQELLEQALSNKFSTINKRITMSLYLFRIKNIYGTRC
jgi:hypothetical protein